MNFNYILLDRNNLVHTILSSDEERSDFESKYVKLDNYSGNVNDYIHARWIEESSTLEHPPGEGFRWIPQYSEWRKVGWEQELSNIMLDKIFNYYYDLSEEEKNVFSETYLEGNDISWSTGLIYHLILRIFRGVGLEDDRITDQDIPDEILLSYYQ